MRFTLHLFGCELFSVYIGPEQDTTNDEPGDHLSNPIGFTASFGDARWGTTPQFEEYE